MSIPKDILQRHLDLIPLGGRRRGLVRCVFHDDARPSLSVDLDRGFFHCFGCGAQGGTRRFAELVGERANAPHLRPPRRARSPLDEARVRVLVDAQRQHEKLESYRDLFAVSDFIRKRLHLADQARRLATALGTSERIWDLLAKTTRLEGEALAVEEEVDAILAEGPLS